MHRDKLRLRAALKIKFDSGKGVSRPAHQPKPAEERKKGGKPRDALVDNLVFEFFPLRQSLPYQPAFDCIHFKLRHVRKKEIKGQVE